MQIVEIRNIVAHSFKKYSFNDGVIANLCHKLNYPDIYIENLNEKEKEDFDKLRESPRLRFIVSVTEVVEKIMMLIEDSPSKLIDEDLGG